MSSNLKAQDINLQKKDSDNYSTKRKYQVLNKNLDKKTGYKSLKSSDLSDKLDLSDRPVRSDKFVEKQELSVTVA